MDRVVNVSRCRRTGAFLLHPFGTFRGYGAFVGVNPYRESPADVDDASLGQIVVTLLALSGPTGRDFTEAKLFLEQGRDDETNRIRSQYGLEGPALSTSKLARRFLKADVEQRHGQKSWIVQPFRYDSRLRSMTGSDIPPIRVRQSAGSAALGAALRAALAWPDSEVSSSRV